MKFTEKAGAAIKQASKEWDLAHPIDYLWREHFGIPFGSPEHLRASFIDQQRWYEERLFIQSIRVTSESGANKGTVSASRPIDMRGMTESDIEELEAKYTGAGSEERLKKLIPEGIWQKVSTGRS